jgi:glyoxylase-like metal-dependent hydrolase (beta-lactamase superfamily II)
MMLRIVRVLAPNPSVYTLEGTNTWVVGADPSVVIDPGPDDATHLDAVAEVAGRVGAVLLTHDHPDHAPGAPVFAARVGAPLYAFRYPGAEHVRDGQTIHAGELTLAAIHTPGHTSDHVAFHLPGERALFTGDAVLGRGTSFIDPPDGDLTMYLRSLTRMQELDARTLYPGHGPVILDAAAKLQEYVHHRADREAQVLAVMADGTVRIMPMVETIYADHPKDVHALAARSVLAHLLKLQAEGRVTKRGSGLEAEWSLVTPRECARCGKAVRGRARYCSTCSLIMLQEGAAATTAGDAAAGVDEAPAGA